MACKKCRYAGYDEDAELLCTNEESECYGIWTDPEYECEMMEEEIDNDDN